MGFYRADMRYSYAGQYMQNTLHYRDRDPFTGDLVTQSQLLGEKLNDHFFPDLLGQWQSVYPTSAQLIEWAIMPYDQATFGPALSSPVLVSIGKNGNGDDAVLPPGMVVIMRFLLRTAVLTSGLYQPRRSYLAIGPVAESHVDENGILEPSSRDWFNVLGTIFAGNVGTAGGVGGWAPVRFGEGPAPLHLRGFAEVDGCTVRSTASYRKSRQPE